MSYKLLPIAIWGFVSIILLAGCTQGNTNIGNNPNGNPSGGATIRITATGYEPAQVTIKRGESVTWTNTTDVPNWPASARHPTHTVYPGSNIEKCNTPEANTIFDACRELANGESYTFTFDNVGEWAYHDHVNAQMFGRITVTE